MRHKPPGRSDEIDNSIIQKIRFNGRDADPGNLTYFLEFTNQVKKRFIRISSEITNIHAGQNNFFFPCLNHLFYIADDVSDGVAPAVPTGERDRTIRTIIITTILDLYKRTGAVAVGPGGNKIGGFRENGMAIAGMMEQPFDFFAECKLGRMPEYQTDPFHLFKFIRHQFGETSDYRDFS